MKANDREVKLVRRLLDLTKEGVVPWEETADDQAFQATLGSVTVVIHEARDEEDDRFHYLEVLNSNGQVADSLYPYWLTQGGLSNADVVLDEIYSLSKRTALKADDMVDEALKELDNLEPEIPF